MYPLHYEETSSIKASPKDIFEYADNHRNFSAHMEKPTLMMGGGSMILKMDKLSGKTVGSHVLMEGKAFGIGLFLDEVITKREPPFIKEWKTIGDLKLLVIGHYKLGFKLKDTDNSTQMTVYIDYSLPDSLGGKFLGVMFGKMYAKWCVRMITKTVSSRFN